MSDPTRGWCERAVEEELPGLHLVHTRLVSDRARRDSPPSVRERLRALSNRWAGAHAVNLRRRPVPAAYRVFYRHIGLDPDVVRTPIEEAMLARMMQGGFHSNHLLADALLITLVDTGVPVWALDAATIEVPLGIRASRAGESLGGPPAHPPAGPSIPPAGPSTPPVDPSIDRSARLSVDPPARPRPSPRPPARASDRSPLPAGQLVVADARSAVAVLFGEIAAGQLPGASGRNSHELELFTLQVPGVPSLHVEEALWMCRGMLEGPW